MALSSGIEGLPLTGPAGTVVGTVTRLLYHPSEAVVVGAMVRPPAVAYVLERPETILPLATLEFREDRVATTFTALPSSRRAADLLGLDPDLVVIWTHMPVHGPSGEAIGVVSDIDFDPATGQVRRMEVAGGAVADAAHGRYLVEADDLLGYREGAVRVAREHGSYETSGGLAKAAASAAVAAGRAVRAAGEAAENAVVAASGAAGRAIRQVREGDVAGKAARRARSTWADTVKAFRDGMRDDDPPRG